MRAREGVDLGAGGGLGKDADENADDDGEDDEEAAIADAQNSGSTVLLAKCGLKKEPQRNFSQHLLKYRGQTYIQSISLMRQICN